MNLSLRKITRTTSSVYDAEENLIGRVFRDGNGTWFAQERREAEWMAPSTHRSRKAALTALEPRP